MFSATNLTSSLTDWNCTESSVKMDHTRCTLAFDGSIIGGQDNDWISEFEKEGLWIRVNFGQFVVITQTILWFRCSKRAQFQQVVFDFMYDQTHMVSKHYPNRLE